MNYNLGVDVGGVIIDRHNDGTDTSFFGPNFLLSTAVVGVFEALRSLNQGGFTIHLVSKCGPNVQKKTRQWLAYHDFFEKTGIPSDNLHFCLTRPEKAPICRALGATHFVDDRLDVLDHLVDVAHLFLFQPNAADARRHQQSNHRATRIDAWAAVAKTLQV